MENVSSELELLELRRDGKITEDEYKQLLDAMNKSATKNSQKTVSNSKKYAPWVGLALLVVSGLIFLGLAI